jgi:hypothetical protein
MKKQLRLFFLLLLLSMQQIIKAQHCGYDGAFILVLHVQSDKDTTLIPNLKIMLFDSAGKPIITTQTWDGQHYKPDTATFKLNPQTEADLKNPNYLSILRFWFAKNNYVCYLFCKPAAAQIKIEDIDGEKNRGNFKTQLVNISQNDFYPLCSNYSSWMHSPQSGFVKNYKPLQVRLQKK